MGLPYYDLFRSIMKPQPRPLYRVSAKDVDAAMRTYGVNEPQAKAILGSLETQGFSLIQGFVVFGNWTGQTLLMCICSFLDHLELEKPQPS